MDTASMQKCTHSLAEEFFGDLYLEIHDISRVKHIHISKMGQNGQNSLLNWKLCCQLSNLPLKILIPLFSAKIIQTYYCLHAKCISYRQNIPDNYSWISVFVQLTKNLIAWTKCPKLKSLLLPQTNNSYYFSIQLFWSLSLHLQYKRNLASILHIVISTPNTGKDLFQASIFFLICQTTTEQFKQQSSTIKLTWFSSNRRQAQRQISFQI